MTYKLKRPSLSFSSAESLCSLDAVDSISATHRCYQGEFSNYLNTNFEKLPFYRVQFSSLDITKIKCVTNSVVIFDYDDTLSNMTAALTESLFNNLCIFLTNMIEKNNVVIILTHGTKYETDLIKNDKNKLFVVYDDTKTIDTNKVTIVTPFTLTPSSPQSPFDLSFEPDLDDQPSDKNSKLTEIRLILKKLDLPQNSDIHILDDSLWILQDVNAGLQKFCQTNKYNVFLYNVNLNGNKILPDLLSSCSS